MCKMVLLFQIGIGYANYTYKRFDCATLKIEPDCTDYVRERFGYADYFYQIM